MTGAAMNLIGENSETPLAFTELLTPAKIAELRDLVRLHLLSDDSTFVVNMAPTDTMCEFCRCMTTTENPCWRPGG
jgi:hypothetical protein